MKMMTKEDYMKLPKERLAELLVERDIPQMSPSPTYIPTIINRQNPCAMNLEELALTHSTIV